MIIHMGTFMAKLSKMTSPWKEPAKAEKVAMQAASVRIASKTTPQNIRFPTISPSCVKGHPSI